MPRATEYQIAEALSALPQDDIIAWALAWESMGYAVVPAGVHWQDHRWTAAELRAHLTANPTTIIQALTGKPSGGLAIIDIDNIGKLKHPKQPDGLVEWNKLVEQGVVPKLDERTFIVKSPNGGLHYYHHCDTEWSPVTNGSICPSVDLLCGNHLVTLPPSLKLTEWGEWGRYKIETPRRISPLPEGVRRAVETHRRTRQQPNGSGVPAEGDPIPSGERNRTLFSMATAMRSRGAVNGSILAMLLAENEARCVPPLPNDEVERIASSAATYEATPKVMAGQQTVRNGSVPAEEYGDALEAWMIEEPGPRKWLIDGVLPDKWAAIMFGDGGSGKSTLAMSMALHVVTGRPWAARDVDQGNVLFIDAELDDTEFSRRLWPLCRGMGMTKPPEGIFYWRMPKAISRLDIQDHILTMIVRHSIKWVVVDSLTIATHLSDQNLSNDLLTVLFTIQKWGTPFLFIDHHAKSTVSAEPDQTSPYGSVYKRNATRAMIYLQGTDKGAVRLHCRKNNFGPKWPPFSLGVDYMGTFPEQVIVYHVLDADDPRSMALDAITSQQDTLDALYRCAERSPTGVSAEELAVELSTNEHPINKDAARMRLMRSTKDGLAKKVRPGFWLPLEHTTEET